MRFKKYPSRNLKSIFEDESAILFDERLFFVDEWHIFDALIIKAMIMWALVFIIPVLSIVVLGLLVREAPEVANDLKE